MKIHLITLLCTFAIVSCSQSSPREDEEEEITAVADQFVKNYFNFNLKESCKFCTTESVVWLKFIASNMSTDDIKTLKAQKEEASCKATKVKIINDTMAVARYTVYNYLRIDTLGKAGEITDRACYDITLVKRLGKWKIRMEGPLQNEKRNLD